MGNNKLTATITLTNNISELEKITAFIEETTLKWSLPFELIMPFNLVMEEAFTNIVNYGFTDNECHKIELGFEKIGNLVRITLKDDGIPYDPTKKDDPDITSGADERPVGGLGIFLIRKMMDNVTYERENGHNHLYMEKIIR